MISLRLRWQNLGSWLSVAATVATMVYTNSAQATSVVQISHTDLIAQSENVVVGEVVGRRSFWLRGRIYTAHQIQIHAHWKGENKGATIEILGLGGVVGEVGQRVGGAMQLALGSHAVFYIIHHSDGRYYPVAMSQGSRAYSQSESVVLPSAGTATPADDLPGAVSLEILRLEYLRAINGEAAK